MCAPSMVKHVPVLLEESLGFLKPEDGGRFADLTYGGGGHSDAILGASEEVELVSFDCDPDALVRSEKTSSQFGDRFTFHDL
ncbi:MAG: 16S rRNA (cytosine(1402)-N(4))-methyltransferase, partial [Opitutae bacterium]|nr:16S rRNA (cytosine(1402)-N(4))-methyltransferase [Opitutae bacterium]